MGIVGPEEQLPRRFGTGLDGRHRAIGAGVGRAFFADRAEAGGGDVTHQRPFRSGLKFVFPPFQFVWIFFVFVELGFDFRHRAADGAEDVLKERRRPFFQHRADFGAAFFHARFRAFVFVFLADQHFRRRCRTCAHQRRHDERGQHGQADDLDPSHLSLLPGAPEATPVRITVAPT